MITAIAGAIGAVAGAVSTVATHPAEVQEVLKWLEKLLS